MCVCVFVHTYLLMALSILSYYYVFPEGVVVCVCCISCSKVQKVYGKVTGPLAGVFSELRPCFVLTTACSSAPARSLLPRQVSIVASRDISPASTSFFSLELAHSVLLSLNVVVLLHMCCSGYLSCDFSPRC